MLLDLRALCLAILDAGRFILGASGLCCLLLLCGLCGSLAGSLCGADTGRGGETLRMCCFLRHLLRLLGLPRSLRCRIPRLRGSNIALLLPPSSTAIAGGSQY